MALFLVLGGAVNHGTEVSLDYVAGSTAAVSLFWVALVVAAALVLAGAVGWVIGRGGDAGARGKLEKELERTYRRLRECEAKLPRAEETPVADTATLVAPVAEPTTAVAPTPVEETTAVDSTPAEDLTVVVPEPAEEATVVVSDAEAEGASAGPETAADAGPASTAPAGDEPAAASPRS